MVIDAATHQPAGKTSTNKGNDYGLQQEADALAEGRFDRRVLRASHRLRDEPLHELSILGKYHAISFPIWPWFQRKTL